MFLIHLQHVLQSRADERQSFFTLSFPLLNPKPCLALHITSLTHSHTRTMQFLNTLPSGSAVSNTMGILLPGPTSLSFPFAFPYPPFFNKTNYSSGKSRKNSSSYSPAYKYSIFLRKLVQTVWQKWIFNTMSSKAKRMTMLFSECFHILMLFKFYCRSADSGFLYLHTATGPLVVI